MIRNPGQARRGILGFDDGLTDAERQTELEVVAEAEAREMEMLHEAEAERSDDDW